MHLPMKVNIDAMHHYDQSITGQMRIASQYLAALSRHVSTTIRHDPSTLRDKLRRMGFITYLPAIKDVFGEVFEVLTNAPKHAHTITSEEDFVYLFSHVFVTFAGNIINVDLVQSTANRETVRKISDLVENHNSSAPPAVRLNIVVADGNSLRLKPRQVPTVDLELTYYSKSARKALGKLKDFVLEDKPVARLHLLTGPPGTGKTSFLRHVFQDTGDDVFLIFVPALEAAQFCGREGISLLTKQNKGKKVVIIIEDADCVLATRTTSSAGSTSSLLNIVDGLFAEMFDVRVVATTNLGTDNIDPAMVRNGRMGSCILLDMLNKKEQLEVAEKIGLDKSLLTDAPEMLPLCDLFAMKSDPESTLARLPKKKVIGFTRLAG